MPKKIVVIGGGITGLSAAHRLIELNDERNLEIEVLLVEKSGRLGGAISTVKNDGYLVELGPDMFFTKRPWALNLSKRLGLESELIETNEERRGTSVLWQGKLTPVPEGFLMLAPSRIVPFLTTPLFSLWGKIRMLMDLLIPKKSYEDESLASFVRRRFGDEALARVAQPMIGGIYTADPEKLSINATMPQFVQMEEEYGSVIRGMMRNKNEAGDDSGARYSQFLSFKDGMETLTKAIGNKLPQGTTSLNEAVNMISRNADNWEIETDKRKIDASGVILTTPAYHAGLLLKDTDAKLYEELVSIEYASSAVVILAYKKESIANKLHGFGFVVPDVEKSDLIACSYSSNKFDGRAQLGHVLLRVFVGGALNPDICDLEDQIIIERVKKELARILGTKSDPEFTMLQRYPDSMPQYHLGHIAKVGRIKETVGKIRGLQIAGNAYDGVGIPDSVHSGEQAAETLLAEIT